MRNLGTFLRRKGALGVIFVLTIVCRTGFGSEPADEGTARVAPEPSGYLWGALVRASNRASDGESKTLETGLAERLGETFSYKHFQLLGEHKQPVSAEYETWILPSEELYMKVDSKGPVDGGLGLHLQLWRRENVILKTDVILNSGSPVFITGPKWGEDQLLFVVLLREQP